MLRARALLFDLDGVLADSTASVDRNWRAWAARHGMDGDALMQVVHGRRAIDTIRDVAPHLDADVEHAWLVEAEATDMAGVAAEAGAAELLPRLVPGTWAVVTSGVRPVALARLRACGLPIPELLVPADEIARGKPDPEGYLTAARRLGVAPAQCLVFEDAPAGVAAGRAAGMRCVGLATTHAADELAGATTVAASLAALRITIERAADGGVEYVVTLLA